jgi:hypothetical protein
MKKRALSMDKRALSMKKRALFDESVNKDAPIDRFYKKCVYAPREETTLSCGTYMNSVSLQGFTN